MIRAYAPASARRLRAHPNALAGRDFQSSSPRLRVLMTVDAAGGVWRYAMELARGLRPLGFDTVFVGQGPAPSPAQQAEAAEAGHLAWVDGPLDWMAHAEDELSGLSVTLPALVEEWQADILHLNYPSQRCNLLVDVPVLAASHSCVATWWDAVKGGPIPPDWRWQFRRQRDGLRRADAVVAPSESHSDALRRIYGPLPQVHVVPNAISAVLEGQMKEHTIFAAARWWDEGKNAAVLDRAAAGVSWPVFMAGPTEGPGGQRVRISHARNECLAYSDLLTCVSRAGIFVSPSLYEPFGLAALEAARAGAALILSDIPTYQEFWHGSAVFFDPRDANALIAKIEHLAAHPLLRADLGRLAAARSRRFMPDVQARTMARIYEGMLDGTRLQAARENWA